jgi:lipopolysaccharide/colanic/teichoic acid biosynthesis glycosyltransferase
MSIVGPRPEIPELDQYLNTKIPNWKWRSMVKPGLTGWAQVNYEYASDLLSSKEKLAYDLYYLKNNSLTLDLEIVLSTLRTISNGSR